MIALYIRHGREQIVRIERMADGEEIQHRTTGPALVFQVVAAETNDDGAYYPIDVIQKSYQRTELAQYPTREDAEAAIASLLVSTGADRIIDEREVIPA